VVGYDKGFRGVRGVASTPPVGEVAVGFCSRGPFVVWRVFPGSLVSRLLLNSY